MAGFLLYLIYILRVRFLTGSLKKRLKERADERIRIARELHDTLLQSIHGLMLRIHFAAEELPVDEPVRKPLQLALQRADDVFVEARQRIEFLRDEVPEEPDFALQLAKVAEDLDLHQFMSFQIIEEGERRFLKNDAQSELCRIAREALINTLHHAKAKSTEISLVYERNELSMKCSDTGIGIPIDVMKIGRRSGHWGLIGMKERAASIEAKFQVWSAPGAGTQIEIRVPARRAYRFPASNSRWLQQLQQFRRSATGQDTPA
jgi:signal transduction histidine kinase